MSILTNNTQEPTVEQKIQRAKDRAISLARQTYQQLITIQKQGIDIVWNNPQGLTPEQVVAGLGTDAVKVFDFHAALTELIVEIATKDGVQPEVSLPTKNFTRNVDGTVTILEEPYGS